MKNKYGNVDFTSESGHKEGLVVGLLLGAAIGACAAILLAPKSGKATRDKIKELAGRKAGHLNEQWDNAKEKTGQAVGEAKDAIGSAAEETGSRVKDLANDAENEIGDGLETIVDRFQKKY